MLKGHMGGVRHSSFSRNGRLLITASEDKTVKVRDVSVTVHSSRTLVCAWFHILYLVFRCVPRNVDVTRVSKFLHDVEVSADHAFANCCYRVYVPECDYGCVSEKSMFCRRLELVPRLVLNKPLWSSNFLLPCKFEYKTTELMHTKSFQWSPSLHRTPISRPHYLQIWNLPSQKFMCTFTGHNNWVRCATFRCFIVYTKARGCLSVPPSLCLMLNNRATLICSNPNIPC